MLGFESKWVLKDMEWTENITIMKGQKKEVVPVVKRTKQFLWVLVKEVKPRSELFPEEDDTAAPEPVPAEPKKPVGTKSPGPC